MWLVPLVGEYDMEREGEFEFDFSESRKVEKLDDKNKQLPQGMQLVDFVVDHGRKFLLIEVKDPSCCPKGGVSAQKAIEKQRIEFVAKMQNDDLIANELTPKARDSYCMLHLMHRDTKPMLFVFFLGAKELQLDPALILNFQERLRNRLHQETDVPWARKYVEDCVVVTETTWADVLPEYPMSRVP